MRISDLSRRSGAPVPTIKFYLRERLLMPGTPTARNQAVYGEKHLRRVRLIRALAGIGGLELASVRELLAAVDDTRVPLTEVVGAVNRALCPGASRGTPPPPGEHADEAARYVDGLSWDHQRGRSGSPVLAEVIVALRELGCDAELTAFDGLAALAEQLAVAELDLLARKDAVIDRGAAVAQTVLLNVAFTVLHRMAHQHHALLRHGADTEQAAGRDD
ncbi:MerR family transcriptional regulator [Micromonospora sp. NPDC047738]|uniref:MerR family transcriptional regulator n=1 Tax=Micromonospora sp. NPDC047738 TaxID=3155741 RepID=UPI0033CD474C